VHLNTQAKGIANRAEQTSATCFGAETWGTYANQNPIMHQLWQQNLQGQTQGTMHHMQRQMDLQGQGHNLHGHFNLQGQGQQIYLTIQQQHLQSQQGQQNLQGWQQNLQMQHNLGGTSTFWSCIYKSASGST
jgi:hypothetical protein